MTQNTPADNGSELRPHAALQAKGSHQRQASTPDTLQQLPSEPIIQKILIGTAVTVLVSLAWTIGRIWRIDEE